MIEAEIRAYVATMTCDWCDSDVPLEEVEPGCFRHKHKLTGYKDCTAHIALADGVVELVNSSHSAVLALKKSQVIQLRQQVEVLQRANAVCQEAIRSAEVNAAVEMREAAAKVSIGTPEYPEGLPLGGAYRQAIRNLPLPTHQDTLERLVATAALGERAATVMLLRKEFEKSDLHGHYNLILKLFPPDDVEQTALERLLREREAAAYRRVAQLCRHGGDPIEANAVATVVGEWAKALSPGTRGGSLSDYLKYRGKCKELAQEACSSDTSLRLVRGYYHCPMWGKQAHWWAVKLDGTIVDPSVNQFPTKGAGAEYEEYDGTIECEFCHKQKPEADAYFYAHHAYCSYECYGHDVGF